MRSFSNETIAIMCNMHSLYLNETWKCALQTSIRWNMEKEAKESRWSQWNAFNVYVFAKSLGLLPYNAHQKSDRKLSVSNEMRNAAYFSRLVFFWQKTRKHRARKLLRAQRIVEKKKIWTATILRKYNTICPRAYFIAIDQRCNNGNARAATVASTSNGRINLVTFFVFDAKKNWQEFDIQMYITATVLYWCMMFSIKTILWH